MNFLFAQAASRRRSAALPWWELADTFASEINSATQLCETLALPIAEIKALWLCLLRCLPIITGLREKWRSDPAEMGRLHMLWETIAQELRASGIHSQQVITQIIVGRNDWYHLKELCRLQASVQAFNNFNKAFHGRGGNSPQAKYAEARLSARRALMEYHNPLLDEWFPEWVETLKRVCSQEAGDYVMKEINPRQEEYLDDPKAEPFLDVLHVLAHDQKESEEI